MFEKNAQEANSRALLYVYFLLMQFDSHGDIFFFLSFRGVAVYCPTLPLVMRPL